MQKSVLFDRNTLSSLISRNATAIKVIPVRFKNITNSQPPSQKVIFIKFPRIEENHKYVKIKASQIEKKSWSGLQIHDEETY